LCGWIWGVRCRFSPVAPRPLVLLDVSTCLYRSYSENHGSDRYTTSERDRTGRGPERSRGICTTPEKLHVSFLHHGRVVETTWYFRASEIRIIMVPFEGTLMLAHHPGRAARPGLTPRGRERERERETDDPTDGDRSSSVFPFSTYCIVRVLSIRYENRECASSRVQADRSETDVLSPRLRAAPVTV
jgi:hypothetical protein